MTSAPLFNSACTARLVALKAENRYCVCARLEKSAARFPVFRADIADGPGDVVVWASNVYLAMGCSSVVCDAVIVAHGESGAGAGGTENHFLRSFYSMEGDIAPIAKICALARRFGALTYLDEVHAVGMYGPRCGGVAECDGVADQVDIVEGTFGKAYSLVGGYIAGRAVLVDYMHSFAPGFVFTTAPPPMVAAGALASVRHLKTSEVERAGQRERVATTRATLPAAGFPPMPGNSHMLPILIAALTETFDAVGQPRG